MSIGIKIKEYLREFHITQIDLSEKARISPSKLNLSLNGKRKLTVAEYQRICWALNVDSNKFMEPWPDEEKDG